MSAILSRLFLAATLFLSGVFAAKHCELIRREFDVGGCDCARHCPCHPCR